MDKLKNYLEITRAYDVGTEVPSFIQKKIDQRQVLAEARQEIAQIPEIDLNGSDLKEQYKARAHALSLQVGAKLIDHDRYERLLEQNLSGAIDVAFNRLIKTLNEKVNQDLETLDDLGLDRLLVLVDSLPNPLTTGLLPSTSRLISLVKIEGPYESLVSASAREFDKAARSDRREALKSVSNYPFASLAFITSLGDLEQRRKDLASLLAPVGV